MRKYQCEDVCSNEKYKMGYVCCHDCVHKKECLETGEICDSWELKEHCPMRMNGLKNARMNDSAPEMYEVLKQIVSVWFNYDLQDWQMINANSDYISQAEKLIARIEGRELDESL